MSHRFSFFTFSSPLILVAPLACMACAAPERSPHDDSTTSSPGDGDDTEDTDDTQTSGTTGEGVVDETPDGTDGAAILPARIRRLTNSEYNATVKALLGTELQPADTFPPDTRQQGFTVNEAQRVDPVLSRQLDAAATALADEVVTQLDDFAPCPDDQSSACADSFIQTFGKKAYRRPLTEEDASSLRALFDAGMEGGDYASGIHLVVRGILQSPGFLYVTEIGEVDGPGTITMTGHEIAASLAYLFTGAPPDEELLAAEANGTLSTAEGREKEARRLLATANGQNRTVRIVREWLGIDRITATAKDARVYEAFDALRPAMHQETEDFVKEVLKTSAGSVEDLLGAPWTMASADLASMYGASGSGRVEVPDRPGLLNRAAFLSVYAHAHETSPVLRGTAVLRRINCEHIELPESAMVQIVPPVPDPNKTTRERYSIHSEDAFCHSCHRSIDPLGFSFEQFDGMGKQQTMEGTHPIDSTADVEIEADFDGSYASSSELAAAISTSEDVRECFARYLFRANVGEATGVEASEDAFVKSWSSLGETEQKSLIEILTHLSTSDLSVYRNQP